MPLALWSSSTAQPSWAPLSRHCPCQGDAAGPWEKAGETGICPSSRTKGRPSPSFITGRGEEGWPLLCAPGGPTVTWASLFGLLSVSVSTGCGLRRGLLSKSRFRISLSLPLGNWLTKKSPGQSQLIYFDLIKNLKKNLKNQPLPASI